MISNAPNQYRSDLSMIKTDHGHKQARFNIFRLLNFVVITFLAPILSCWACSILIHEPFTRKEQVAGGIALLRVVLIARPQSFFLIRQTLCMLTMDLNMGAASWTVRVPRALEE